MGSETVKIGAVLVAVWFAAAFLLSVTAWFERFSTPGLFVIGAVTSSVGFLVLHFLSERFRGYLKTRSLRRITLVQSLRFFGSLAFLKAEQNILPELFALPTAIVDVVIAGTSFLVASRLVDPEGQAKRGFAAWHLVGLAGLALSAVLAYLTSSHRMGFTNDGVTSQTLRWFPMSLVPTFIGPIALIGHLQALAIVFGNRRAAAR